jgi:putative addiction module component (TIGR02574 family)
MTKPRSSRGSLISELPRGKRGPLLPSLWSPRFFFAFADSADVQGREVGFRRWLRVVPWSLRNRVMKRDLAALLEEALALPAKDRTALAEALLVSLDGHAEDDTVAAWKAETERRVKELDEGTVATIPWPEVRRRLFDRARRRALRRLREGLDLQWVPSASRDDLHRR